jgi:hypothetical protein
MHDPTGTSVGTLNKDLREVNTLFKDGQYTLPRRKAQLMNALILLLVNAPREAAIDSKWLMMVSDIGATKAKLMKHDPGAFDVDDFISQLVLNMGGGEDLTEELDGSEWAKIGRKALAKSRRVPTIGFMQVSFESLWHPFGSVLIYFGI